MTKKLIAIGGGLGPMAGVELHRRIIEHTKTNGTDQDHIQVVHTAYSDIVDRNRFLLGQTVENPADGMLKSVQASAASANVLDQREMILGIPCNTFHSPRIWERFTELLYDRSVNARIVHIIEEVCRFTEEHFPGVTKVGVLATTGTIRERLYHTALEAIGVEVIEVPDETQDQVHDAIYNPEWGLKAVSPPTKRAHEQFEGFVHLMKERGAEAVILGCTEIPLTIPEEKLDGIPMIDSVTILARALIRGVDPQKLKPL